MSIEIAEAIVAGRLGVAPSAPALSRCLASHDRLMGAISEARHVYGVTTGFGPLANRLIDPADGAVLQQNLVHHLATGLGAPLPWAAARATCLARLSSIMQGLLGASSGLIDRLVVLLNSDLAPSLPERGTVGASGDLTPLAHLVLAFQGRGAFLTKNGAVMDGEVGLAQLGLAPFNLEKRDGLALVNGTSAMTGVALVNMVEADRLAGWAIASSAGLMEVMGGRMKAWAPLLSDIRPHPGQAEATRRLNAAIGDSTHVERRPITHRKLEAGGFRTEEVIGQDAYTLRCVPQVIGGVLDTLSWHREVVKIEINSVSDNPVFPEGDARVAVHGGNFMGSQIGLASDALGLGLVALAGLAERQIARLTDERLNNGLPAFLHQGVAGLNSGFMGAQVTASATLAEMRSQGPASTQSISTNGANQDVVSMGTIAARRTSQQVGFLADILAIEALSVAQTKDISGGLEGYSTSARALYEKVRALSPELAKDRPLSGEIAALSAHLRAMSAK